MYVLIYVNNYAESLKLIPGWELADLLHINGSNLGFLNNQFKPNISSGFLVWRTRAQWVFLWSCRNRWFSESSLISPLKRKFSPLMGLIMLLVLLVLSGHDSYQAVSHLSIQRCIVLWWERFSSNVFVISKDYSCSFVINLTSWFCSILLVVVYAFRKKKNDNVFDITESFILYLLFSFTLGMLVI